MKTMKQILAEWLTQNDRYDGFCSHDEECACKADEIAPCGDCYLDCVAGHLVDVPEDSDAQFLIQQGPRDGS